MEIETTEKFGEIPSDIVKKINKVEKMENSIVVVEFQIIYPDIWMANIIHKSKDGKSVHFTSLNLYQKDSTELCYNMQDGKVNGFNVEYWVDAYKEFPDKPEHFIAELLHELFIVGWGIEDDAPSFGEDGYSELDEEKELAEMAENEVDENGWR